jgi:hypothetical protein
MEAVDGVVLALQHRFPAGAVTLLSSHRAVLTFQLAAGVAVADVFAYLEAQRHVLGITDHSLSQTTLDQVHTDVMV